MLSSSRSTDARTHWLTATELTTRRCGDTGVLVELDDNSRVLALAAAVRAAGVEGLKDLVPALNTLLLVFDPERTEAADIEARLRDIEVPPIDPAQARTVEIPVIYDGEDLGWVATHCGLDEREVVRAHTGTPWRVAFCGFAPGFAYLVGGDPRLRVPRRGESRVVVPAGAVALAGQFSAVYPRRSPGGWQLLGHTTESMWDTSADPPALLLPGYEVRFRQSAA
ncbi:5-oxoprolinase subunit B family protein [Nocardioides sp. LHG3406-4]|uniref:5-oxoprolinase subunit B family protein n=1 Tax=Nocardioides sp. LHG3406-4 TaxID=2804575 RepID=UPI003CE8676B